MKRHIAWISLVVLASLGAPARLPAQGSTDFLKVVPDNALIFITVQKLGATNTKVQGLAKLVGAPLPQDPLAMLKGFLGVDKGLDEKGTLIVVAMPGDGKPLGVVLVPVTDYKAFLAPLKPKNAGGEITEVDVPKAGTVLVGKRGNYAAFADQHARDALKRVVDGGKDVSTAVAPLQDWLADNDASVVFTNAGVKMAAEHVREGLKTAKLFLGALPPEAAFVGDIVDGIDNLAKIAGTDVTCAGAGIRVDAASNVTLSKRTILEKGSGLAKSVGSVAALEGGPLMALPSGSFVMAGGGPFPESAYKAMNHFSMQMIKAAAKDAPEEKLKKLDEAAAQMSKGVRGMTFVMGAPKAKEAILAAASGTIIVDDAKAYLDGYEKGLLAMNAVLKDVKALNGMSYDIKKMQVGGVPALEVVTDMSKVAEDGGDQAKKMMETMFGPGGKMTVMMAAADNKTILMRYTGGDSLKTALAAFKAKKTGLAMDADVTKVAAMLPAGSQWALYVSPKGTMEMIGQVVDAIMPGLQLPAFPKTLPVALGVKTSASAVDVQLVVPAGVLEGIGGLVKARLAPQ
jgi:hypothetical protein